TVESPGPDHIESVQFPDWAGLLVSQHEDAIGWIVLNRSDDVERIFIQHPLARREGAHITDSHGVPRFIAIFCLLPHSSALKQGDTEYGHDGVVRSSSKIVKALRAHSQ